MASRPAQVRPVSKEELYRRMAQHLTGFLKALFELVTGDKAPVD
jgi:hypothetical protein